ncbi:TlpA family protein disulfide reductase [Flavobacteriaceae bacterium TP-CH-4]|uniref:TlpA family protein disulfide reductase n=1 Tax=Pelagihabitans pacificus TaxID=2696054 RepID=A0A967AQP9_9FLAO|nr:TlpA disulfide reductase family protein [Pelagihabitans pacificus]NHF57770.1 TlpA family protein disulfide reductase [Pelagihabitans pacificus]
MKKSTFFTLLVIGLVLSLFLTPLGYQGKVLLNRLFSFTPGIVAPENRETLPNYNWKLKDPNWEFFSFEKSRGKVIFINFWASWRLPCAAELQDIQRLYEDYGDRVDFYIITNEERPPVQDFMQQKKFTFPVTYLIIGEPAPVATEPVPSSYIIDKKGNIVVRADDIADWDNRTIRELLDKLLAE